MIAGVRIWFGELRRIDNIDLKLLQPDQTVGGLKSGAKRREGNYLQLMFRIPFYDLQVRTAVLDHFAGILLAGEYSRNFGFMRKLLTITFTTLFSVAPLQSVEITHRVTVQPIIVYSGEESANPTAELFEAETDKILAQAGIDVHFKSVVTVTNSLYFDLSSDIRHPNSLHSLAQSSGNGASADPSVLNLWFVNSIDNNP